MTLLIVPLLTAGIAVGSIQNSYAGNNAPIADANGPYLGFIDSPVSFDGTNSSDQEGDPLTFDWDFGDGQSGTGPTPTNTYTTAGEFEVCLTVNDGNGAEDMVCTTATISLPTFILLDNTSGGDCEDANIGKWNDKTKTCRLTVDLEAHITIGSNDITLNCNGHLLDGDGSGGEGILVSSKVGVTIKNCHVTDYDIGIQLESSVFNTLQGNNAFLNNGDGIFLSGSAGNTLQGNTANDNVSNGIRLSSSDDNKLSKNTATGNFEGISLSGSDMNTLNGNTATGNNFGIHLNFSDDNTLNGNTANENKEGIVLFGSDDNTLIENTANENDFDGILILSSSMNNKVTANTATGNDFGIFLFESGNNTLIGNTAFKNLKSGFFLDSDSGGNTLEDNDAKNNDGFGFRDLSSGGGTAGTANTYTDNKCVANGTDKDDGSEPDFLCSPQE